MTVNVLFAVVAVVIIVVVFSSRARKDRSTKRTREQLLRALAPVVSGTLSDGQELTGTYKGHPVEASLRTTGRLDSSSGKSRIEVILIVVRRVSGANAWGFYTSISFGPSNRNWRSVAGYVGKAGQLLSHLTPFPIDPRIDERILQNGMSDALDRLTPPDVKAPYVLASFVPDAAPAVAKRLQQFEASGRTLPARAREEAAELLQREQGGHLRIEVERTGHEDPIQERFRGILDAAIRVAELNAAINSKSSSDA